MNNPSQLRQVDLDEVPPADMPIIASELSFSRDPMDISVPHELIRSRSTPGDAFKLAIWASGLDDRDIYEKVGIDQGYFSNIKKSIATLKANKEPLFCEVVGNLVYPEWRASRLGCTLIPIQRLEELEAAERKAKELEIKVELLMSVLGQRAGKGGV